MSDLPTPINRHEQYLDAIANGTTDNLPTPPITREEVFLDYIARNGGGSGGGDVTGVKGNAESNYRKGNVNITPENIGLGNVNNTSDANKPVSTAQQTALDGKVDKVVGKGLSENDYTDADKAIVDGVTSALSDKVDKVTGKGLSTNDYDNTAKGIVDGVTTALSGKANSSDLGDKSNLTTTDKSSAVAAINEVNNNKAKLLGGNNLTGEQKLFDSRTIANIDGWGDSYISFKDKNSVSIGVIVPNIHNGYVALDILGVREVRIDDKAIVTSFNLSDITNASDSRDAISKIMTTIVSKGLELELFYNIKCYIQGMFTLIGSVYRIDSVQYSFNLVSADGASLFCGRYFSDTSTLTICRYTGAPI